MINLTERLKYNFYDSTGMPPEMINEIITNGPMEEFVKGNGILHLSLKSGEAIDIRYPEEIPVLKSWLKSKSGVMAWENGKSAIIQKDDKCYNISIGNVYQSFATKAELMAYINKVVE